ncbi:MAG: GntR family transcriptional regulator [Bacilli bacterium]|jgi:DNA-binding GntR family transcriptional regulator|nr:GntR family transcriptional regulator [Bacilli bacterium]
MAKERSTPRYIKIAQDICGKVLTGDYPEGTLLKGRSILGAEYGVSPETVRKALNILEKEKVVSSKRGVGVYVDSVLHAQDFANEWKSETQIKNKYAEVLEIIKKQDAVQEELEKAIDDMKDSFTYQTTEAVKFSTTEIPQGSWINGKTVGEVYFWNYTEATIVAVVGADNITRQSVGPDFVLHSGDKLIFVGKDDLTFDRVLSFLTYGVLNQNADQNAEGGETK